MNPEKALFQAFALPNKRQRYLNLLDSNGGRERIRLSLDHFKDLDPRFTRRVDPGEQNPIDLLRILRGLGATAACYVISSDKELDGREMGLAEALSAVIGRGAGTFLSCVPGELAYFEGEDFRERYICCREPLANPTRGHLTAI